MADKLKKRLHSYSFAQHAEDTLNDIMEVLRKVKWNYAQCAHTCYSGESLLLTEWQSTRQQCLDQCRAPHTAVFKGIEHLPTLTDEARGCVLRCGFDRPIAKEGEEDLTVCEELCYESYEEKLSAVLATVSNTYFDVYFEKP